MEVSCGARRLCAVGRFDGQRPRSSTAGGVALPRRACLTSSAAFLLAAAIPDRLQALIKLVGVANAAPPQGYKLYKSPFDGFSFEYPQGWSQVRGAGAAGIFFRNPSEPEENVIVDFSSPSSSRYKGLEDLGSPDQAAERILKQYLTEFMSTRLGVRRESSIVSASSRIGQDGRQYYEVEVSVKSYANNNQMAVMPAERVSQLEWSRRYLSVLGVENSRLYQLRLQAPERLLEQDGPEFRRIMDSFSLEKLAA